MKNTLRVKTQRTRVESGRTSRGIPQDIKARIAYWEAYAAFLERMMQDPRFYIVDKDTEVWDDE